MSNNLTDLGSARHEISRSHAASLVLGRCIRAFTGLLLISSVFSILLIGCGAQDPRTQTSKGAFGDTPENQKYISSDVLGSGTPATSAQTASTDQSSSSATGSQTGRGATIVGLDGGAFSSVGASGVEAESGAQVETETINEDSNATQTASNPTETQLTGPDKSVRVEVSLVDTTVLGSAVCFLKSPGTALSLIPFLPGNRILGVVVSWLPGVGRILSSKLALAGITGLINNFIDVFQSDDTILREPSDRNEVLSKLTLCNIRARIRIGSETYEGWNEVVASNQRLSDLVGEDVSVELRDNQFYDNMVNRLSDATGIGETEWEFDPVVGECSHTLSEDDIDRGSITIGCTERFSSMAHGALGQATALVSSAIESLPTSWVESVRSWWSGDDETQETEVVIPATTATVTVSFQDI